MAGNKLLLTDKRLRLAVLLISACLVAYNVVRILYVPMTIDECQPYASITRPFTDIISFPFVSSNDHLLNSLLRKIFVQLFSDTPFWMRFDSLLAQLLFLWCTWRLCRRLFKSTAWQLSVFLLMNLHPAIFEFWGLSRGYGLALAWLACSVYCLLCYVQDKKIRLLYLSLFAAALSAYSNFSFLDYYFGIILFIIVRYFLTRKGNRITGQARREILALITGTAVLAILVAGPITKLIKANELYYGGTAGIVPDTIYSLCSLDVHMGATRLTVMVMAWFMVCSSICVCVYWTIMVIKKRDSTALPIGIMLSVLLITPAVCIIAQHILLHTLYPIDRTALYFIPLYMLAISYWLYAIAPFSKLFSKLTLGMLLAAVIVNFTLKINSSTSYMWWFNANDPETLNRMQQENKNKGHKIRVCVDWLFTTTFGYYIETRYGDQFEAPATFKYKDTKADTSFDYYFITRDRGQENIPPNYITDTSYDGGLFILYKKVR